MNPCPAFFTTPANFKEPSDFSKWELLCNGMSALVFNCQSEKGVMEVMAQGNDDILQESQCKWKDYLKAASKGTNTSSMPEPIFYIKVVTEVTGQN